DRTVTGVQTCALPISSQLCETHPDKRLRHFYLGSARIAGDLAPYILGRFLHYRDSQLSRAFVELLRDRGKDCPSLCCDEVGRLEIGSASCREGVEGAA